MPEGRLERTRAAYRCPACDGDGVTGCYDDTAECDACGGSGVRLEPLETTITAASGPAFITPDWMAREIVMQLESRYVSSVKVQRSYLPRSVYEFGKD